MKLEKWTLTPTAALLLVAICLYVGYQAAGTRMQATPTRGAVVQLVKVMDSIQERAVIDTQLERMTAGLEAEKQGHIDAINALNEKMKAMVGDDVAKARALAAAQDPAFMTLMDEIDSAKLKYAAWGNASAELVDLEKSLVVQKLYRSVKDAIAALAEAEGYDFVLIDDSQGELRVNPDVQMSREAQVLQQMSVRKLLYTTPLIDITDDLIVRMNNEYNAGQQVAPGAP